MQTVRSILNYFAEIFGSERFVWNDIVVGKMEPPAHVVLLGSVWGVARDSSQDYQLVSSVRQCIQLITGMSLCFHWIH